MINKCFRHTSTLHWILRFCSGFADVAAADRLVSSPCGGGGWRGRFLPPILVAAAQGGFTAVRAPAAAASAAVVTTRQQQWTVVAAIADVLYADAKTSLLIN